MSKKKWWNTLLFIIGMRIVSKLPFVDNRIQYYDPAVLWVSGGNVRYKMDLSFEILLTAATFRFYWHNYNASFVDLKHRSQMRS